MSTGPVPQIARHLARGTTSASARRALQRMAANVNNPAESDVINEVMSDTQVRDTHGAAIGASYVLSYNSVVFDMAGMFRRVLPKP